MKNTNDNFKIIMVMLVAYSFGLFEHIRKFKNDFYHNYGFLEHEDLLSLKNAGAIIVIFAFLSMAYKEKRVDLKVIYLLASFPFFINSCMLSYFNYKTLYFVKGLLIIVLILFMLIFLLKCKVRNDVH